MAVNTAKEALNSCLKSWFKLVWGSKSPVKKKKITKEPLMSISVILVQLTKVTMTL